jgi:site-specific recombinase XerC
MRELTGPQQPTALGETIDIDLVQELMAMWRSDLVGFCPATRTSYRRGAAIFFNWLTEQDRLEVSHLTIRSGASRLSALAYKPGSVNTWLVGLRSYFPWAYEQGYIPFKPALGIRGPRQRGAARAHKRNELSAREVLD